MNAVGDATSKRPSLPRSGGMLAPRQDDDDEEDREVQRAVDVSDHGDDGEDRDERNKQLANNNAGGAAVTKSTALTKVRIGMIIRKWKIVSRIGAGSFGETFVAHEIHNGNDPLSSTQTDDPDEFDEDNGDGGEGGAVACSSSSGGQNRGSVDGATQEVCIKVEQESKNVLRLEVLALKKVQGCGQVVRYVASGRFMDANYLVMERLGPNLVELRRNSQRGIFSIYTMLKVGISCLKAIRGVHELGLIHRDIKPSNFVIGLRGEGIRTCFLIDFGLARRYRRTNGEVRPPRDEAGFRGTSRYASLSSHKHQDLGRVDDLWSLLFMLIEFATGTLPWRRYKEKDDIGRCKQETIGSALVKNLPREFGAFLEHLDSLSYASEPKYDFLLALLMHALDRRGYPSNKLLDWEEQGNGAMPNTSPKQQAMEQSSVPRVEDREGRTKLLEGDELGVSPSQPQQDTPGYHLPVKTVNNKPQHHQEGPGIVGNPLPEASAQNEGKSSIQCSQHAMPMTMFAPSVSHPSNHNRHQHQSALDEAEGEGSFSGGGNKRVDAPVVEPVLIQSAPGIGSSAPAFSPFPEFEDPRLMISALHTPHPPAPGCDHRFPTVLVDDEFHESQRDVDSCSVRRQEKSVLQLDQLTMRLSPRPTSECKFNPGNVGYSFKGENSLNSVFRNNSTVRCTEDASLVRPIEPTSRREMPSVFNAAIADAVKEEKTSSTSGGNVFSPRDDPLVDFMPILARHGQQPPPPLQQHQPQPQLQSPLRHDGSSGINNFVNPTPPTASSQRYPLGTPRPRSLEQSITEEPANGKEETSCNCVIM